jgi:hypothetical protein
MRTVSRLGILGVIVLWVVVTPVGAQVPAEDLGVPPAEQGVVAARNNPYTPPPCVAGVPFADVTCTTFYDAWIEQFYRDGITAGCGGGNYCPNENVTRAQMAVFIEAAMHGTSYWSPGDAGNGNTVAGYALPNNSPYAQYNTAVGFEALYTQSYANGNVNYDAENTAVGVYALWSNQPDGALGGLWNTAVGMHSLEYNTTGSSDTGVGDGSLGENTTGDRNVGIGYHTLGSNTTGSGNTGIGWESLFGNTTGSNNTTVGYLAALGGTDLTNAVAIGYLATADASNHVRIGNTDVTQIGGQVGWSALSDIRAKTNIANLDLGLDFVMALRPVSFTLKQGNGRTDLGFIAQDVETLLGDGYNVLGIGADKDRTLSLRYTDFIAPMVKAIQEQQATIAAQQAAIADLQSRLAGVDELKAQVQALLAAQKTAIAAH